MNFTEHKDSQLKNLPRIALVTLLHALLITVLLNEVRVKLIAPPDNTVTIIDPTEIIPPKPEDDPTVKNTKLPTIPYFPILPPSDAPFPRPPILVEKPTDPGTPFDGSGDIGGDTHIVEPAHRIPLHIAAVVNASACDKPEYPAASVRTGEEGIVTLAMLIGIDGRVLEANVKKSSGFKALDKAAKLGLSLCKFKPASTDGIAEKSWTKIQYAWKID